MMPTKSVAGSLAEYEARERADFNRKLRDVEAAPLNDRKVAARAYAAAPPEIVVERIGWLIDGNYGYGAYVVAREALTRKRMNRPAWFAQTIAALEWSCPAAMARAAYNALTPAEQDEINARIQTVIDRAEAELKAEQERT